jgi:hypothetical protein
MKLFATTVCRCDSTQLAAISILGDGQTNITVIGATIDGETVQGVSFPVAPDVNVNGTSKQASLATVSLNLSGAFLGPQCILVQDSLGNITCNSYTGSGVYNFPGVVVSSVAPVQLIVFTNAVSCADLGCSSMNPVPTTTSTTSTTTTSTTTITVGLAVFNDTGNTINSITVNGFVPELLPLPLFTGESGFGFVPYSASATVVIDSTLDVTGQSIMVSDAVGGSQCQNITAAGTYTYPGLNGTDTLLINGMPTPC